MYTDEKISRQLINYKTCCPIFIGSISHAITVKKKSYKLKGDLIVQKPIVGCGKSFYEDTL